MESSIYDSDLNDTKLVDLISSTPELAVLKFFGEISVELDGNIEEDDDSFDAPFQEGSAKGGGVHEVVENFSVMWYPNEDDLDSLKELVSHGEMDSSLFEKFKNKVLAEPKKTISYDLTSVISDEKLEDLKDEYLKEFGGDL